MRSKVTSHSRIETVYNKINLYFEEIMSLKDGGISYLLGFGLLTVLLIPFLFIESLILLITGKDLGWFQSSTHPDRRIKLDSDNLPLNTQEQSAELKDEGDYFLENYEGQTVDELIQLQKTHRIDSLVLAFASALDTRRDAGEALNETELTILAVDAFEREVNNGGFSQFFYNTSVEYAPIIVNALNNIGCVQVAELAQNALDILAVDSLSPKTIENRMDPDDEVLEEALGDLDDRYFNDVEITEDPEYALFEYIKVHQDKIRLA